MDLQISYSKDRYGDTEVRLINHAEVIERIRDEVTQAVNARVARENRAPTANELEQVKAAVRSVPAEITL